jgi:uncharacterized protein (TIGR00255 family)
MTGFGKGRTISEIGTITVEIRSLNHRYFDMVVRLPNHLSAFEERVRDYVKKKIRRGRINLTASWEGKVKTKSPFILDFDLARRYHRQLQRLRKDLRVKDDLGLSQIVAMPEVISYEQKKENLRLLWPHLKKATDQALNKLGKMRETEGKSLMRDLLRRQKSVRFCLQRIEEQLPRVIARYRTNLLQKVKVLSGAKRLDQDRIAEEVALFVRNSDVSEELTRVKSHLKGFRQSLRSQKEAGKELDFVAQELFRESNTIGAKTSDFRISSYVIKMKTQIEKMREQLQNVE